LNEPPHHKNTNPPCFLLSSNANSPVGNPWGLRFFFFFCKEREGEGAMGFERPSLREGRKGVSIGKNMTQEEAPLGAPLDKSVPSVS